MFFAVKIKKRAVGMLLAIGLLALAAVPSLGRVWAAPAEKDFIKWVDFDVPASVLRQALDLDAASYGSDQGHVSWLDLLAYLAAKYGGDFSLYRDSDLEKAAELVKSGEDLTQLASFSYYREAYGAVLGGFAGEYTQSAENGPELCYGLTAYSPIAKTFPYSDYDDFGVSREYGYRRRHRHLSGR